MLFEMLMIAIGNYCRVSLPRTLGRFTPLLLPIGIFDFNPWIIVPSLFALMLASGSFDRESVEVRNQYFDDLMKNMAIGFLFIGLGLGFFNRFELKIVDSVCHDNLIRSYEKATGEIYQCDRGYSVDSDF